MKKNKNDHIGGQSMYAIAEGYDTNDKMIPSLTTYNRRGDHLKANIKYLLTIYKAWLLMHLSTSLYLINGSPRFICKKSHYSKDSESGIYRS